MFLRKEQAPTAYRFLGLLNRKPFSPYLADILSCDDNEADMAQGHGTADGSTI